MTDITSSTRDVVYISFDRSDDMVRYSFISHLYGSLRRKGMIISASSLDKSSKESTAIIKNIEVFVVVISEKYLLSAECLHELAEIVVCQQNNKAVVVPIFYDISRLEVVHRSDILRELLREGNYSIDQVSRWNSALTTDSYEPSNGNQYGDSRLVEDISRDVYEKVFPTKRIGIYSRLLEIENLLCKQSWGVRSIGIWGMPGIGKSTLAKAAFDQMSSDYEASCFIKDFDSAFRKNGLYGLLKEHFGQTLMEEFELNRAIAKPTRKRVLIVLDNVCKSLNAELFLNEFDHFGPGSLVIITSRDKQVFVQCWINDIYEVTGLNEYEAKKLFFRCASGEDRRKEIDLETLTPSGLNDLVSVMEFASGNPLTLSCYGKMLSNKKPKEMEMELLKIKENPTCQIKEAFKSTYSTLNDKEKAMFLDIACFFRGEDADYVKQLFEGCGFFPHVGMYVLVEKCLVSISENKVQMHNLIQNIGREIATKEAEQLDRHCRLWDSLIIQSFLQEAKNKPPLESKDVEDIEAIFFEIPNLNFFVNPIAFKSMHNLRFLKIYSSNPEKHQGLLFREPLESLSSELRLLHWENYSLQSLPQDFDPRHLVELNMPYSQLHQLWGGTKTLGMLKTIRLCHSPQLVDIDDLLKAQNIEVIDLRGCVRFQRFIPIGHLQHLRVINLTGCVKVRSIPEVPPNIEELYLSETGIREISLTSNVAFSTHHKLHCMNCGELVNLQTEIPRLSEALKLKHGDSDGCSSLLKVNSFDQDSLKVLDLSGCSELESIQRFPRSLKELYLSGTAIREVSSSISHLTALSILDLTKCKKLQHLPVGMSNLTSLVKLMLSGCSELESIQDFPRNLKELSLAGTAIKEVSSSLCDLTELVVLDAGNCKMLQKLPIGMGNLNSLVTLTLSGCSNLEDIHDLPRSLEILKLAETPVRKMPSSFEDLTELVSLDLNHCKKLQHLRMCFFRSAVRVELFGCSELEYILGSSRQNMELLHIDGTNEVMLQEHAPCKVSLIWETWRRFQLLPRETIGSKFILTLMPFVTTPYRSKLPFSISSSLVSSMYAVVSLFLSYTYLLDMHIPEELCQFPSLKTLDLRGNDFSKLPEGLKQIRNLKSLILCHCPNLESLPELPQSLEILNAHSCVSLENVYWNCEKFPRDYTFRNCFNLSPSLVFRYLEKGMTTVAQMAMEDRQNLIKDPVSSFSVPASVGLKCIFHLQEGSSVKIQLTPRIKKLLGFRVSVVVAFSDSLDSDAGLGIRCVCRWKSKKGLSHRLERIFDCLILGEVSLRVREDHMFVFSDISMHPGGAEGSDLDILRDVLVFEFLPVNGLNRVLDECCTITKCGVELVLPEEEEQIHHDPRQPTTFAIDDEGKMVEKISNDISDEVNVKESREVDAIYREKEKSMREELNSMRIIPGEERLKELEEKLDVDCDDKETRILGLVGMAGIGKTYLAEKLFDKLKTKFCRYVFIKFGYDKSKEKNSDWLRETLVEGLLGGNYHNLRIADWKNLLIEKKVVLVLDNVTDKKQIGPLLEIGNCNWIKKGSRIVVTTRDKSLTEGLIYDLYEVPGLNEREGLTLFRAQICSNLQGNFMEMCRKFVDYAGGNPLAIKEFGKELNGKEESQWEARLEKLTEVSNEGIRKVLRNSYENDLDEMQKDAFLDIVCLFRSQEEYRATSLLDSIDSSEAGREVRNLMDKFFINISNGRIEMHDLLFTMGKELVQTTRKKYWMPLDRAELTMLRYTEGRDEVRGIVIDMSKMKKMPLDNQAFVEMSSLRYLKVYNSLCPSHSETECKIALPDGLEFPKDNIVRYLHWVNFPGKELPPDFEPRYLVDLRLPYSRITTVWNCAKVALNLKWVDLSHSSELISISSLSDAPNLLRLNLEGCTSLEELPEEMQKMKKLVFLNLRGCESLLCLPNITMDSLKTLILSGCSNLQSFKVISESLETLYLNGTAIYGLPPAIGNLHNLNFLNLKDCKNLVSLPDCLGKLKSLQELKLSGCSKLKIFPDVKEIMENFRVLLLDRTSITEMPSSIGLSSLRRLCLSKNYQIFSLQFDMDQMFHLKWLELKYCKNLTSLPRLPPNLQCLNAYGCSSLKAVASPLALPTPTEHIHSTLIFTNCHKLEQVSKNAIISYVQKKSDIMSDDQFSQDLVFKSLITTCFPGCELPAWFKHQALGPVLKLELPQDCNTGQSIRIALSVVVSFKEYKHQNNSLQVKCTCEFTDVSLSTESFIVGGWSGSDDEPHTVASDHVFIGYTTWLTIKKHQEYSAANYGVALRFEVTNGTSAVAECKVLKCGFSLVDEPEEAENTSWEATSRMEEGSSYTEDVDDYPSGSPTKAVYKRLNSFLNLFRYKRHNTTPNLYGG